MIQRNDQTGLSDLIGIACLVSLIVFTRLVLGSNLIVDSNSLQICTGFSQECAATVGKCCGTFLTDVALSNLSIANSPSDKPASRLIVCLFLSAAQYAHACLSAAQGTQEPQCGLSECDICFFVYNSTQHKSRVVSVSGLC